MSSRMLNQTFIFTIFSKINSALTILKPFQPTLPYRVIEALSSSSKCFETFFVAAILHAVHVLSLCYEMLLQAEMILLRAN